MDPKWSVVACKRETVKRCKRFGSPHAVLTDALFLLEALSQLPDPLDWCPTNAGDTSLENAMRFLSARALHSQLNSERAANE